MSYLPDASAEKTARLHYLDAFRVAMLLLGIPFHASEVFRSGGPWLVSVGDGSDTLRILTYLIHAFRMFAFFFISGFFSALILKRSPVVSSWLDKRMRRLAIPLVLSALLLAPFEAAAVAWFRTEGSVAFFPVWAGLLRTDGSIWLLHRWFLVVLVIHTVAVAVMALLVRRSPEAFERIGRIISARPRLAYAAMVAGLGVYGVIAAAPFQFIERTWIIGLLPVDRVLLYAAPFAVGAIIAAVPGAFDRFVKTGWIVAAPAIVALAIYAMTADATAFAPKMIFRLIILPCGLLCTQVLVAASKKLFSKASPIIEELIDAAFVIYLAHMVCVLAFSQVFIAFGVQPILAATLTVVLTLATTYAFYRLIRSSDLLGYAFNGGPFKRGRA